MVSRIRAIGFLLFLYLCPAVHAEDAYVLASAEPERDQSTNYSFQLLRAALEASKPQYGPYTLITSSIAMPHKRQLLELQKGELVNISAQSTSPEWEQVLDTIHIPIDKGITDFRIALIDGRRQDDFSRVSSLEQLRKLSVGVGEQWAWRDIFVKNGLPIVTGSNNGGLLGMLMEGRFDYLPRAVDEAYREQERWVQNYPHLAIEKSFMLYSPMPRYYFVSPRTPKLATRLRAGLEKLIADGEFDRRFMEYYGPLISRAGLCERTVYRLTNADLSTKTPLKRANLWFHPYDGKNRDPACRPQTPPKQ